jgi:hypothetical protein
MSKLAQAGDSTTQSPGSAASPRGAPPHPYRRAQQLDLGAEGFGQPRRITADQHHGARCARPTATKAEKSAPLQSPPAISTALPRLGSGTSPCQRGNGRTGVSALGIVDPTHARCARPPIRCDARARGRSAARRTSAPSPGRKARPAPARRARWPDCAYRAAAVRRPAAAGRDQRLGPRTIQRAPRMIGNAVVAGLDRRRA